MEIHNFPPDSFKDALIPTSNGRDQLSVEARTLRLDRLEWFRTSAKEPAKGWGPPGSITLLNGDRGTGVGLLMARYAADAHAMGRQVISTENVGLLFGQVVKFSWGLSGAAQIGQLARLAPANAFFVISDRESTICNPSILVSDDGYKATWLAVEDAVQRGAQWLIASPDVAFGTSRQMMQAFGELDREVVVRSIWTRPGVNGSGRAASRWPSWARLRVLYSDWRNTDPGGSVVKRWDHTEQEIFDAAHLVSEPALRYLMAERRQELGA